MPIKTVRNLEHKALCYHHSPTNDWDESVHNEKVWEVGKPELGYHKIINFIVKIIIL
jgi:hypothetical protein